jgi:hypothetical protein
MNITITKDFKILNEECMIKIPVKLLNSEIQKFLSDNKFDIQHILFKNTLNYIFLYPNEEVRIDIIVN